MTRGDKQRQFTLCIALLIQYAYEKGYELTFGDAYRDPRSHGELGEKGVYGRVMSNHKRRLAVDFNLFKDGVWQTETEDFKELGTYWETLNVMAVWGGQFNDGNHFSFEHEGYR